MNKKILIIAAILVIGAVIYFNRQSSERTDLVIINEVDAPAESSLPSPTAKAVPAPTLKTSDKDETPAPDTTQVREELSEVLSELPEIEDLQSLSSEEAHHTPNMVKDGGIAIGVAISRAQNNPVRREETGRFLLQCAEKQTLVPALRAVCWNQLLNKITEWDIFVPISGAKVPEDIKNLATQLE